MKKLIRLLFLLILIEYSLGNICSTMTMAMIFPSLKCSSYPCDDNKACFNNPKRDISSMDNIVCIEIYCWEIT